VTPSHEFLQRLKKLSDADLISERDVCRRAGLKSESQLAAARKRASALNWDHVAALATVLQQKGYSRNWLLFGEEPELAGDLLLGDVVRLGPGASAVTEGPVVEPSPLKKRRHQSNGATPNKAPAARQDGRRTKRTGSGNVNHR
jgi:hypothetical protein